MNSIFPQALKITRLIDDAEILKELICEAENKNDLKHQELFYRKLTNVIQDIKTSCDYVLDLIPLAEETNERSNYGYPKD